jgi:hypothetical protein
MDRLNEGSWDSGVADTTPYFTWFVFTLANVKQTPVHKSPVAIRRTDVRFLLFNEVVDCNIKLLS